MSSIAQERERRYAREATMRNQVLQTLTECRVCQSTSSGWDREIRYVVFFGKRLLCFVTAPLEIKKSIARHKAISLGLGFGKPFS